MKEIKLPSGAILKIMITPFAVSKALYKAILKEAKGVKIDTSSQMTSFFKDLLCTGFSSDEIESCLWDCMKHCTYNDGRGDIKISADTFEPITAREDYMKVCVEVTKENVGPFAKNLYVEWKDALAGFDALTASPS